MALAYAAVDPCIARPDLGQQQGPVGKHRGSANVRGAVEGRECYLKGVAHRPPSGEQPVEPHPAQVRYAGRNQPGTG